MQSQYSSPYQAAAPVLEYVGVGRRFVAFLIDGIILGIIYLLISWIPGMDVSGGVINAHADFADRFLHMSPATALSIFMPLVYYIVMEAVLGASVGKLVLGIRVVKLDGSSISWGDSIVRNLLRYIDAIPGVIPYLLGAILIWISPRKQRLGDRAANTVVVRRQRRMQL